MMNDLPLAGPSYAPLHELNASQLLRPNTIQILMYFMNLRNPESFPSCFRINQRYMAMVLVCGFILRLQRVAN